MNNLQNCASLLKSCFPDEKIPNLRYEDQCNGFISYVIRTQVGGLNLILKSSPTHPAFRKQLMVRQLYLNEMYFYEKVLPRLGFENCPKIYKVDKVNEILLMEDFSASGFGLMRRGSKYVLGVFKEFAKFHARSLVIKQKDKGIWDEICSNLYKDLEDFNEESELTGCILEQCEKVLPFVQRSREFQDFTHHVVNVMNKHDAYKHSIYSVVIHGDSWKNNIMINEDESEIRFIDFQQARIGSVVQDLSYFFYTCCEKDDYEMVWHHLEQYHDCLLKELKKLGADTEIFTLESLIREWKNFACYGFGMTVVVLHGICSLPEEFPCFAKVLDKGGNIFRALNFTSKLEDSYFEKLCALIHHFIESNLFPKYPKIASKQ